MKILLIIMLLYSAKISTTNEEINTKKFNLMLNKVMETSNMKNFLAELNIKNPKFNIDSLSTCMGPLLLRHAHRFAHYVIDTSMYKSRKELYFEILKYDTSRCNEYEPIKINIEKLKNYNSKSNLLCSFDCYNDSLIYLHFEFNKNKIPEKYYNSYIKYGYLVKYGFGYYIIVSIDSIRIIYQSSVE